MSDRVDNLDRLTHLALLHLDTVATDAEVAELNALLLDDVDAQDPQFSQFFANPLYINPAFVGTSRCPRIFMNYRNEWPALSGTFVTSSVSYESYVSSLEGGLGVILMRDEAGGGTLNTTSANILYAYHGELGRYYSIRAGIQAGYIQKSLDWDKCCGTLKHPDHVKDTEAAIKKALKKK